ncbi:MAG TPA: DUF6159 family protein [Chthonomonadaceae bacterium]|nr:DUF6159 family protein [Chthonomonadaceae bacterium]
MDIFERFQAGYEAAQDCWEVLKQDKKLLLFPLASAICCLLVLVTFGLPLYYNNASLFELLAHTDRHHIMQQTPGWFWVVLFAFYFCNYFVIAFFNSGLVYCAVRSFQARPVTVGDGIAAAIRCLPQLIGWSLISATIGLALQALESNNRNVGRFLSGILGAAWTVLTYFVVPVLVLEKVGAFKAIGRSTQILRKTWGEGIFARIGIGWFLLPFWLLGVGLIVLGSYFLTTSSAALGGLLLGAAVLYLIVMGLVNSALETILLGGLYQYATEGLSPLGHGVTGDAFYSRD